MIESICYFNVDDLRDDIRFISFSLLSTCFSRSLRLARIYYMVYSIMPEIATVSVLLMLTYKHECNSKNKTFNSHIEIVEKRSANQINSGYSSEQSSRWKRNKKENGKYTTSITYTPKIFQIKPTTVFFSLCSFDVGSVCQCKQPFNLHFST